MATPGEPAPVRKFQEAPPVDYSDVPAVLAWLVRITRHLDECFDRRLAAIETRDRDSVIRSAVFRTEIKFVSVGIGTGLSIAEGLHQLGVF